MRDSVRKIVKISECKDGEANEDVTVQRIKTEACGISYKNKDYDLSEFTTDKIREQTSSTLLRFISKLISNGKITKFSMSLSQVIQYCITKRYNQSTLGIVIKLNHKFRSRKLIDTLNAHGYTVTYEETLNFRKSAANMSAKTKQLFI
ncbi:hypothetical protein DPMN_010195 [Dreissena polymorpha]|uniref:Uncharacterized protein n=1 Tax=Dreissena polymorpha TaxID=45954 RepID=A0A9D4N2S1_DREPO|nr:hypothetical protein DPMN_010195 [Dreissena polymorpha]